MNDADLDLLSNKVMGWERRNAAWRPHEDIAQAFEVVDKMVSDGWDFQLTYVREVNEYEACFSNLEGRFLINGDKESFGYASDPANAICIASLAAKKAVKGEE